MRGKRLGRAGAEGGVVSEPGCVAILNTNEDIVTLLRALLESEGCKVVTAHIRHLKDGRVDLLDFVKEFDPAVVLYDVAPPYEENWRFLGLLRDTDALRGRRFVITTTNRAMLERLVGPTGAHEILGKPFDLDEVVRVVKAALSGEGRP
jgi:DNA-binding response OmpR family regulator